LRDDIFKLLQNVCSEGLALAVAVWHIHTDNEEVAGFHLYLSIHDP
jgi:hypothetical protein